MLLPRHYHYTAGIFWFNALLLQPPPSSVPLILAKNPNYLRFDSFLFPFPFLGFPLEISLFVVSAAKVTFPPTISNAPGSPALPKNS